MIVNLHYRMDGTGRRLLLLHPVGLDLTFFDSLVAELASSFQVLRVDLRGHGLSPGSGSHAFPTLADFSGDVHVLLSKLDFRPVAIAGFSFGGMVAQELALHFPADVNALITSACGCTFKEEVRAALRERGLAAERNGMASVVESTLERWFTSAFRESGLDAPARDRLLNQDVQSWYQAWNAISTLDTEHRLANLRVPTLCLAAERDMSASPAAVQKIADTIHGSRFEVLVGLPHMLFLEGPSVVAAAIRSFLFEVLD